MPAKMAVNGIRIHACTNQRLTLALRLQQSLNAGDFYPLSHRSSVLIQARNI